RQVRLVHRWSGLSAGTNAGSLQEDVRRAGSDRPTDPLQSLPVWHAGCLEMGSISWRANVAYHQRHSRQLLPDDVYWLRTEWPRKVRWTRTLERSRHAGDRQRKNER